MMTKPSKRLPVGVDLFESLRKQDYYYLDKTLFIKELLDSMGFVNLFTRPRRFGKTLNMSMLRAFFEIGSDPALFAGTKIEKETALCEAYQGKYPVVFLSLKSVEGATYEDALNVLRMLIADECKRLAYLLDDDATLKEDREIFARLMNRNATEAEEMFTFKVLMRMLHAHYGKPVILLIDEYDVPLDKANLNGYYNRMVTFLRGFFGEAFKTNPDLYFAVVTGCLRISKESIFTGVNNLKVDTIQDERYDEYFGFTNEDIRKILADYNLSDAYDAMREWYDGYHFGATDVYCPWDVVCHCDKLLENPNAEPQPYWNNTSSNALVRQFVEKADATTRSDIERLIAGEVIERKLISTLTYEEVSQKIEHLWSVLYLTGYLTTDSRQKPSQRGYARFVIPNREVREIFIEKIQGWFEDKVESDTNRMRALYDALENGDAEAAERIIGFHLRTTISYYDCYEGFYHGFLLGLLQGNAHWKIQSNREAGAGRSDIQIEHEDGSKGIVIEVKRAATKAQLEPLCAEALRQIEEKRYADPMIDDDIEEIWGFGVAFAEKKCRVMAMKLG